MRVVCLLAVSTCCLLVAVGPARAGEPKPEALTARDLLDRMAKAYAGCKSYRDSGVVQTVFVKADGSLAVEKPFRTAFVRPDRFRFEFSQKGPDGKVSRYIIWRKGQDIQTWWDLEPGVKKPESLNLALAGATGVSGTSAHTVPRLLLPKAVEGRSLLELTDVRRVGDARLGKAECYRVAGKFAANPMTLWIDKKTFLVRKIEQQMKFPDFRAEQTTTYEPVAGAEVPEAALDFHPPRRSAPEGKNDVESLSYRILWPGGTRGGGRRGETGEPPTEEAPRTALRCPVQVSYVPSQGSKNAKSFGSRWMLT